jgi:hypothetical protein
MKLSFALLRGRYFAIVRGEAECFCKPGESSFMRLETWRSVSVASGAQESVGEVTGSHMILAALNGLAKTLDAMPAQLSLRAGCRRLEYHLIH